MIIKKLFLMVSFCLAVMGLLGAETQEWLYRTDQGGLILTGAVSSLREKIKIEIPETIDDQPVVALDEYIFKGFSTLTCIEIPASVRSVGKRAFDSCSNLSEIFGMQGVTNMGQAVFNQCENLQSLSWPKNLKIVPDQTFYKCTCFQSIKFTGDEIISVGDAAFYQCEYLQEIDIPGNITSIGESAFQECKSLTNLTLRCVAAPSVSSNAFRDVPSNCQVWVEEGSTGWDGTPGSTILPETWRGFKIAYIYRDHFAEWAKEMKLPASESSWDSTPACWGGWANGFIYTFGTAIMYTPLMNLTVSSQGFTQIRLPAVQRTDVLVEVVWTRDLSDWHTAQSLPPPTGEIWVLTTSAKQAFFRVRLSRS